MLVVVEAAVLAVVAVVTGCGGGGGHQSGGPRLAPFRGRRANRPCISSPQRLRLGGTSG